MHGAATAAPPGLFLRRSKTMSWNPQFDLEKPLLIAAGVVLVLLLITYLLCHH
jgi:hypothetical protein